MWLGTNVGLVKLGAQMKSNEPVVVCIQKLMGYKEISLSLNSACSREGELFFGGYKGYNSFIPEDMEDIQGDVQFAIIGYKDIQSFHKYIYLWRCNGKYLH